VSEPNSNTIIWTIGSGGLIGSAINGQSQQPFKSTKIHWKDNAQAITDLTNNLVEFNTQTARYGSWAIIWAAGSVTTSADQYKADKELELFTKFLIELSKNSPHRHGMFILISSAGGVYAGSLNPPFTEETEPAPIGVYGNLKLAQEVATREQLDSTNIQVLITRVSNAYGPGQDLTKLQGLISRLALSTLTRNPINLFVPLSTVRDFIFTSDLASKIHKLLKHHLTYTVQDPAIRIVASESGTSIGQVLRTCQEVFHRKIPTAMGSHPSSAAQATELRFTSLYSAESKLQVLTPLPVGIKRVFDDISLRLTKNNMISRNSDQHSQ